MKKNIILYALLVACYFILFCLLCYTMQSCKNPISNDDNKEIKIPKEEIIDITNSNNKESNNNINNNTVVKNFDEIPSIENAEPVNIYCGNNISFVVYNNGYAECWKTGVTSSFLVKWETSYIILYDLMEI